MLARVIHVADQDAAAPDVQVDVRARPRLVAPLVLGGHQRLAPLAERLRVAGLRGDQRVVRCGLVPDHQLAGPGKDHRVAVLGRRVQAQLRERPTQVAQDRILRLALLDQPGRRPAVLERLLQLARRQRRDAQAVQRRGDHEIVAPFPAALEHLLEHAARFRVRALVPVRDRQPVHRARPLPPLPHLLGPPDRLAVVLLSVIPARGLAQHPAQQPQRRRLVVPQAAHLGQLQRREVVLLRSAVMPERLDRLTHLDRRAHQRGRRPLPDLVQEPREMRALRVARRKVPQLLAYPLDLPLVRVDRYPVDPLAQQAVHWPQGEEPQPRAPAELSVPLPAFQVTER